MISSTSCRPIRTRRHYGTTGPRIFIDLKGSFEEPVTGFSEDPKLGPATEISTREARMGDIIRPGAAPMRLSVDVIGTAAIDRIDVLHGTEVVKTIRPYATADLGRRVRVLWQGAEYRGRGRETIWLGKLTLAHNRFTRFAPVNFLNPEFSVQEIVPGIALSWRSVTTGCEYAWNNDPPSRKRPSALRSLGNIRNLVGVTFRAMRDPTKEIDFFM